MTTFLEIKKPIKLTTNDTIFSTNLNYLKFSKKYVLRLVKIFTSNMLD
jgi:hypothetical protein